MSPSKIPVSLTVLFHIPVLSKVKEEFSDFMFKNLPNIVYSIFVCPQHKKREEDEMEGRQKGGGHREMQMRWKEDRRRWTERGG